MSEGKTRQLEPEPGKGPGEVWPDLVREADLDQIARMAQGLYVYPLLLIILVITTSFSGQHPGVFWPFAGAVLAAMLMRIVLMSLRGRIDAIGSRRLHWLLALNVCLTSGGVGLLYVSALQFYGFENWTFTILMFWVAGTASGGTISFTPDLWLLRLHVVLLLAPVIGGAALRVDTKGSVFALVNIVLVAFLLLQGHRLNAAYWQQLRGRALDRVRARELEEAKAAAEAASVAKGRFLANMSHEIRTPLHGILGMAQLAMNPDTPPEQSRAHVRTLRDCAQGLLHILNDILDFSKIEAGKLAMERISFSLRELLKETRQVVWPQADTKGLTLECEADPDMPDLLLGDPARLRQVLMNLLGNAAKFTSSGSIRLHVSKVDTDDAKESVSLLFRVTDTGIGIPEEQQQRIFEAFAQADNSATRGFGGTGLGLSISSQLVRLMGGRLWVESTPGAGSTFQFTCRLGMGSRQEQRAAEPPAQSGVRPLRILLAEDNPIGQIIAMNLLTARGHRVKVVSSGLAAIQAWEAESFDLILIDHQMPEMGGIEAVRKIRDREAACGRKRTTIIAVSASAMAGDRERFLAAGMDGYLAKPFRPEELDAAIRDVLAAAAV